jgi:hypothetical protein
MLRCSFVLLSLCAAIQAAPPTKAPQQTLAAKSFKSFTGRVSANKVRLRIKPDLDSHVVRQMSKNDLLLVTAEEGDFFVVEPPKNTKAYIFRSYVIDDVVEGNRVNVRLEPHPDAPIIGQLEAGSKIESQICSTNHKWLEIATPLNTKFYVSKEFLVSAGGPEYLVTMEKRKSMVADLLNAACLQMESECKKSYEDMSILVVTEQLQTILKSYSDFPEAVSQAKEALAVLKETFLNKKIAFLESRAELSPSARQELLAQHKEETKEFSIDTAEQTHPSFWTKRYRKKEMTPEGRLWDTLEESLYLSWTAFHSGKKMEDFYAEQKANASLLTGRLEAYTSSVKEKPGNFVLRGADGPIAYLYSTHVELEKFEGKMVTVTAAPRPNNHFAFPAYFALGVE